MLATNLSLPPVKVQKIEVADRYFHQNQRIAIRDIYDALVETITNADDRYCVLGSSNGRIEIEIERRRKGTPSILRIRDFADGMTSDTMLAKLGCMGTRVSGMEKGLAVRGTNSRGAKDLAALGKVTFESIAEDGRYHKCEIRPPLEFALYDSQVADRTLRERLGIPKGTGTLVSLEINPENRIPHHATLKKNLSSLVQLRCILSSADRTVVLKDAKEEKGDEIHPPTIDGKQRYNELTPIFRQIPCQFKMY